MWVGHNKMKLSLRLSGRLGKQCSTNREEGGGFGGRDDSASLVRT